MNANLYNTTDYERKRDWTLGENKPNSNPIKPNLRKAKMNVNLYVIEDYRKKDAFAVRKNKPNSNPISVKPKMNINLYVIEDYEKMTLSQSKKTNPIKPNFTYPQRGKTEVRGQMSVFCLLSSVFGLLSSGLSCRKSYFSLKFGESSFIMLSLAFVNLIPPRVYFGV